MAANSSRGKVLRIAAPVAAVSGVAWLIGIFANMTDSFSGGADPENLRLFLFETWFGPVAIFRGGLCCGGGGVSPCRPTGTALGLRRCLPSAPCC